MIHENHSRRASSEAPVRGAGIARGLSLVITLLVLRPVTSTRFIGAQETGRDRVRYRSQRGTRRRQSRNPRAATTTNAVSN